ncbi:hypothetical protein FRC17_000878 [Serendipita sp. 399]|nr:hypothetical protein FRC17_000878 [Serendipita sp. 399]
MHWYDYWGQWCKNGNSADFIRQIEDPAHRFQLFLGVVKGLKYLHEHDPAIVHGDPRPVNVLIGDDEEARLCDFGLVRLILEDGHSGLTTTTAHDGMARYLSQELVTIDDAWPTRESDCHALGCIGLEFIYLRRPYARRVHSGPIYSDIAKGVPPAKRPHDVNIHLGHILLWNLFEGCWNPDILQRPSSTQIYDYLLEHESTIIQGLNWPLEEQDLKQPSPTSTPDETEDENEEHDVPDLTKVVKLLNEGPIFRGNYSSVREGICRGQPVAVKTIQIVKSPETTHRKYQRELKAWSQLSHPNILPLLGVCMLDDLGTIGSLVSPWCRNGTSAVYIRNINAPADRIRLFLEVANGVKYLHNRARIIHGDLKPANILIDDDGRARLCDFGLIRLIPKNGESTGLTTTTVHTGTVRYLSRELIMSEDPKPTTESDCHALGCIGFEFAYLLPPYRHRRSHTPTPLLYIDIGDSKPPAQRPKKAFMHKGHILLWDLFEACWSLEPRHRPSSTAIYNYLRKHQSKLVEALELCTDIFDESNSS